MHTIKLNGKEITVYESYEEFKTRKKIPRNEPKGKKGLSKVALEEQDLGRRRNGLENGTR